MSFQITLPAGGTIDKVRELPYPHFSKFTVPYVRGEMITIPEIPEGSVPSAGRKFEHFPRKLPFPTEFLSVAFAASEYCPGDYWELTLDGVKVCERIYTKELPESVSMGNSFGIVYPLPACAEIKFDFVTFSGAAKKVWFNIKFLRDPSSLNSTVVCK
jgi:hypothetical protein